MIETAAFKLFDAHAHFYTDDLDRYPLSETAGNKAVSAEEVRARLLSAPTRLDRVLAWWDAAGVEGGVGVQYATAYGRDNRYLLDCADQAGGRIAPVVVLDGAAPETPDALARWRETHAIAGIRLMGPQVEGGFPWLDGTAVHNTWRAADQLGLVVQLMFLPPTLGIESASAALHRIAQLAEQYQGVQVVVDHMGWPAPTTSAPFGLTPAHLALQRIANVAFKFTTDNVAKWGAHGPRPAQFLRHAVDLYGANRIMWGSDMGNSRGDYAEFVALARDAATDLAPAEQADVLGDTARRLFMRSGRPQSGSPQPDLA